MKVMLQSISAGPEGCVDAGEPIDLPAKEANRLIKSGGARKVEPETKRVQSANSAGTEQELRAKEAALEAALKSPFAVLGAVQMLDYGQDQDWEEGGKPSLDRLKELLGCATLTRKEVDQAAPDALRVAPAPDPGQEDPENPPAAERQAGAAQAAAPAGRGSRSNKP